jgi:transposase
MAKRYRVELTEAERASLTALTRKGKVAARRLKRAQILLAASEGTTDEVIATAVRCSVATVERTRKRFVTGGVDWALSEQPRPGAKRRLDEKQEAYLVALACSDPPTGRECWTMQLLADRLVELQVTDGISDETVRRLLKKTSSSRG